MAGLSQADRAFGPAENFLDSLSNADTGLIARVAGGSAINGGPSIGGVLGDMRHRAEGAHIGNEVSSIVGLIGADRDPMAAGNSPDHGDSASRSAMPVACVWRALTTSPLRFSIRRWPMKAILAAWPWPLRYSRASLSVVEAWVSLLRFSL